MYRYVTSGSVRFPGKNVKDEICAVDIPSLKLFDTEEKARDSGGFSYRFITAENDGSFRAYIVAFESVTSTFTLDANGQKCFKEAVDHPLYLISEEQFKSLGGKINYLVEEPMPEDMKKRIMKKFPDPKEAEKYIVPVLTTGDECTLSWHDLLSTGRGDHTVHVGDEAYEIDNVSPDKEEELKKVASEILEFSEFKSVSELPKGRFDVINRLGKEHLGEVE